MSVDSRRSLNRTEPAWLQSTGREERQQQRGKKKRPPDDDEEVHILARLGVLCAIVLVCCCVLFFTLRGLEVESLCGVSCGWCVLVILTG